MYWFILVNPNLSLKELIKVSEVVKLLKIVYLKIIKINYHHKYFSFSVKIMLINKAINKCSSNYLYAQCFSLKLQWSEFKECKYGNIKRMHFRFNLYEMVKDMIFEFSLGLNQLTLCVTVIDAFCSYQIVRLKSLECLVLFRIING